MIKNVVRNAEGKPEHIGEWDYVYATEFGENGDDVMVATNPFPAGATQAMEEVIVGFDGGFYAADDPRAISHD